MVDAGSRVLLSNPAASRLFGYGDEDMRGLDVVDLIPEMCPFDALSAAAPGCWRTGVKGQRRDGTAVDLAVAHARELPATTLHGDCACVMVRSCVSSGNEQRNFRG